MLYFTEKIRDLIRRSGQKSLSNTWPSLLPVCFEGKGFSASLCRARCSLWITGPNLKEEEVYLKKQRCGNDVLCNPCACGSWRACSPVMPKSLHANNDKTLISWLPRGVCSFSPRKRCSPHINMKFCGRSVMWQTQCLVNIKAKSSERSFLLEFSLSPLIVLMMMMCADGKKQKNFT